MAAIPRTVACLTFSSRLGDGAGGAHLAAEVAGEGAIPHPRDEPGGVEPFQARFPQHRLQAVGQADLHALAAADAAGEKLGLVLGPRGPDEKFVGPPGQGAQADQGHGHDSRRHRGDELASPQVQGGPGRLGVPR